LVLELTYIILITIPYARVSESKFGDAEAKEMLARIAPYTEINHVMQAMYDPFSGNASPYRDTSGQGNHVSLALRKL
jgi:ABC-type cobalt transport system substrate-binding protein